MRLFLLVVVVLIGCGRNERPGEPCDAGADDFCSGPLLYQCAAGAWEAIECPGGAGSSVGCEPPTVAPERPFCPFGDAKAGARCQLGWGGAAVEMCSSDTFRIATCQAGVVTLRTALGTNRCQ